MPRRVVFFVFPAFQILDLTGPLSAIHMACALSDAPPPYAPAVISRQGGLIASTAGLEVATHPADDAPIDTLIVAGGQGAHAPPPDETALVRHLAARARRTASVCTGAFLLAAAGLLDGRHATTHWRYTATLQRRFPAIRVAGERIFVHDGPVWTSAGITAGIDLALALIEADCGTALSRAVAQQLVVSHRRPGGQSQFSAMLALDPQSDRIRQALAHASQHLAERLTLDRLAEIACLSPRQFSRAFRAETGETPARAVERLRTEAARLQIEETTDPIETIAAATGFTDPERMRRAFLRRFGHPPQALRRAARKEAVLF